MVKRHSETEPLETRVLRFIRYDHLVERDTTIVVAVSGGPDSVCLLRILFNLRDELGVRLHVAHLDHMLRSAASKSDAQYVKQLAAALDLPATVEERDVKRHRASRRISMEEAAREVRYAFLAEVAESVGAAAIAVGHTRDDNVETVLMHLVRGTGTGGLRGLQPVVRWRSGGESAVVVRPLLEVSRQETTQYCRDRGLEPRIDRTNLSMSLFRNRVRLELLPLLRKYNPRADEALLRTARISADELAILEREAFNLWDRVAERSAGVIVLKKQGLVAAPIALKRHLLRMALEGLIGSLKDVEARHIEELLEALDKPAGTTISLPGGLIFSVEYDRYLLGADAASLCPFPSLETEFALKIPGKTVASGWHVIATLLSREESRIEKARNCYSEGAQRPKNLGERGAPPLSPFGKGGQGGISGLSATFDFDRLGGRLTVRPYKPGDRFRPLGLGAEKKVGEFMLDAKIPRSWRKRVPIVVSRNGVVWVVGYRIDEGSKVAENTQQILRLELERI